MPVQCRNVSGHYHFWAYFLYQLLILCYVKSPQSCPTLWDPIDGSPPGLPVPGILQARTLVWVAISFFNAWKWKVKVKSLSRVRLLATPWTAAYQARLSMGFARQEYWSGVPLPSSYLSYMVSNFLQLPRMIGTVISFVEKSKLRLRTISEWIQGGSKELLEHRSAYSIMIWDHNVDEELEKIILITSIYTLDTIFKAW